MVAQRNRKWIFSLSFGAFLTFLGMASGMWVETMNHIGASVLFACSGLCLLVSIYYGYQLWKHKGENAKPHIRFRGFSPVSALIKVKKTDMGEVTTSGQPIVKVFPEFKNGDYFAGNIDDRDIKTVELLPRFYRVLFANDPEKGEEAHDAVDVRAEITFRNTASKKLLFEEIEGRWSQTEQPGTKDYNPISSNRITMPPNGQPFLLDIVMKYDEDDECYAHNNESSHRTVGDFRDKGRMLVVGEYDIGVRIRGSNVDKAFWFRLVNQGKGKQVQLTLMPI